MKYFLTLFVIQTTEGRKNLGNIRKYIYEDVHEILRFALNDNLVLTDILIPNIFLYLSIPLLSMNACPSGARNIQCMPRPKESPTIQWPWYEV